MELRSAPSAILHDLGTVRFMVFFAFAGLFATYNARLNLYGLLLFPILVAIELLFFRRTVTSLTFGADGVALKSYAWWRAFIRHAQLSHFDVQQDDKGNWFLRLLKDDGTATLLSHSKRQREVLEWKSQIDQAMAEARRPSARARVRELGRRADESGRWLERLNAVKVDRGSYRERSLSEEDLTLALEDPTCPADERWAAALVLSRTNPRAKLRIAEVAKEVARPEFREALDALAEQEAMDDERAAEWMDRVRPVAKS